MGLWDSGGMISKTVIIEYMGLYCLICVFVTASQAYASKLVL